MQKLKLIRVSETKTEKARVDGKPSREYVSAEFNTGNPFIPSVTRNFFQSQKTDDNGVTTNSWRTATPDQLRAAVGQTFEGRTLSLKVKPYKIGENTVDTYTTVVFAEENESKVFKQSGHPLYEEWLASEAAKASVSASAVAQASEIEDNA